MSFFDNIYGKLFPANRKVGIYEVLNRDKIFLNSYQEWNTKSDCIKLKEDLLKSWDFKLKDLNPPLDIITYLTDYANGFTLYPGKDDHRNSMSYLMEYMKDKLIKYSYRLVHSTRKIDEKKEGIEIVEKYYLKPPFPVKVPYDQIYGNIEIEVLKHDQQEKRLKFLVSVYSDRNYTKPLAFRELLSYLFDN
ncbi:MAG: hypothetical protein PVH48_09755 [Cyclobacteriaceae bacterium]|jgi:hypothetical protein